MEIWKKFYWFKNAPKQYPQYFFCIAVQGQYNINIRLKDYFNLEQIGHFSVFFNLYIKVNFRLFSAFWSIFKWKVVFNVFNIFYLLPTFLFNKNCYRTLKDYRKWYINEKLSILHLHNSMAFRIFPVVCVFEVNFAITRKTFRLLIIMKQLSFI